MKTHISLLSITLINIFTTSGFAQELCQTGKAQRALRNVDNLLCVLCASVVKKINAPLRGKNLLHGFFAARCSAGLLLLASMCTSLTAHAAMQMTSTNNIVVGAIYNNFDNTNDYFFVNKGDAPIKIVRLIPTCTCIRGANDVDMLKPGEKLKVSIFFDAKTVHGKFSRGLWVVTDELENNQTLLRVSGEVLPLFKGFPEEKMNLMAKDKNIVLTNQFTFTATTTNYFLGPPQCEELKEWISFDWKAGKSGPTNVWHLTTVIKPDQHMSRSFSIRFPVTGPTTASDRLIRLKLTVGIELSATPSKLVATTLTAPIKKKLNITAYVSDAQAELLTWQPQIDGIKVEKALPKPRGRLLHTTKSKGFSPTSNRTRFECTISITPTALQELMLMEEPSITFSYPDHQPVTIPVILYEAPAP